MSSNHVKRVQADPIGGPILYELLASMIGGPDRRKEMTVRVTSNDVPDDWVDERTLFQCIEECYDKAGEIPTQDLLAEMMQTRGCRGASRFIEKVLQGGSEYKLIKLPAWRFYDWLQWHKMRRALDQARKVVDNPTAKPLAEVAEKAQRLLANASPFAVNITVASPLEQYEAWNTYQSEKIEAKNNKPNYVVDLPFSEADDKVYSIRKGDPILITAATGLGKTDLANVLAEYYAWDLDLYTIYVSQETDDLYLNQRRMARIMGIPTKYNERYVQHASGTIPMVNPTQGPWMRMTDQFQAFLKEKQENHHLVTLSGNGARIEDVMQVIVRHCDIAASLRKEVIVIWDYLQKFDWSHYGFKGDSSERLGLARIAQRIKNGTQSLRIRSIVFSQESEGEASEDEKKVGRSKRRKPFGSAEAHKIMQVHLSLRRPITEVDEPVIHVDSETRKKTQLRDRLGNLRYYALRGQPTGRNAYLEILKGNDDAPNGLIHLRFEGPLHLCQDVSDEPKPFDNDLHFTQET